jgi:mRNA interferase RelE/StbE
MARLVITREARAQFSDLPRPIQARVAGIFERLKAWPNVSGAKPLRGDLAGSWRIRTGDYRVVFSPSADDQTVTVWRIGYRGGVYD